MIGLADWRRRWWEYGSVLFILYAKDQTQEWSTSGWIRSVFGPQKRDETNPPWRAGDPSPGCGVPTLNELRRMGSDMEVMIHSE